MKKREQALQSIANAGYHDDWSTAVRAACDGKVSRLSMVVAFSKGKRAKETGVVCQCEECGREVTNG